MNIRKFVISILLSISFCVCTFAQKFEFKVVSVRTDIGFGTTHMIYSNGHATVTLDIFLLGSASESTTLASGEVATVAINSKGAISFYDKNDVLICSVASTASDQFIAYNENGKISISANEEPIENFNAEYKRLKQWVEAGNEEITKGKRVSGSAAAASKSSGSKTKSNTQQASTPKYKADSRLIEFLKSPLGKLKFDPVTVSLPQLKKSYKESGLKYKYEYGTVLAHAALFSSQNPGIKLLGQDISFCETKLLRYATEISYSFILPSKAEAGQFYEKLLGTCKASGVDFGKDSPSSNFIHSTYGEDNGMSIELRQYVNDAGDFHNVTIRASWKRPAEQNETITYTSPSQWTADIFGTGLTLDTPFEQIEEQLQNKLYSGTYRQNYLSPENVKYVFPGKGDSKGFESVGSSLRLSDKSLIYIIPIRPIFDDKRLKEMYDEYITSLLLEGVQLQKTDFKTLKKRYPNYKWGDKKVKEVWESHSHGATQYYFLTKQGSSYYVYFVQVKQI